MVALASRFPILSVVEVKESDELLATLSLHSQFRFSRPPLRANIYIDGIGRVLIYVLHLKSKRPVIALEKYAQFDVNDWEKRMHFMLHAQAIGGFGATVQRGSEAALIYNVFLKQMAEEELPTIVLGDLNDTIYSSALHALAYSGDLESINGNRIEKLPYAAQRAIAKFSLYNASALLTSSEFTSSRFTSSSDENNIKPTHYFGSQNSVLNYIFLSKDFDGFYDQSCAEATKYQVYDRHLTESIFSRDGQASDHAQVVAEVSLRL